MEGARGNGRDLILSQIERFERRRAAESVIWQLFYEIVEDIQFEKSVESGERTVRDVVHCLFANRYERTRLVAF